MSTVKDASVVTVTTVATINNIKIVVIENGEKRVAVKPICEALGVSMQGQLERLKSDPVLSSTVKTSLTVGADQKEREMVTIPFKYVFGWLFRIDSRNVKEEARESVLRYQMECYDALYFHFKSYMDYNDFRLAKIAEASELLDAYRADFNQAKNRLKEGREQYKAAWDYTYADWLQETAQLKMNFDDEPEDDFNDEE